MSENNKLNTKLRLLRGLFVLSQFEMADLAGITRVFYGAVEAGRKTMPDEHAEVLGKALQFNKNWLLNKSIAPLEGYNFRFIALSGTKTVGSTLSLQRRKLKDSLQLVKDNFPIFLESNRPELCRIVESPEGDLLALLVLNGDGILLKITEHAEMGLFIKRTLSNLEGVHTKKWTESHKYISSINSDNPASFTDFFISCDLDEKVKSKFKEAVSKAANTKDMSGQPVDEARSRLVARLGREGITNGILLSEIAEIYKSAGRKDLLR